MHSRRQSAEINAGRRGSNGNVASFLAGANDPQQAIPVGNRPINNNTTTTINNMDAPSVGSSGKRKEKCSI